MQRLMAADGSQRVMTKARLAERAANETLSAAELERIARAAPGFIRYLQRRRRERIHPLGTHWRQYSE